MTLDKALKIALECMEAERKRNHSLGLSGLSLGAIEKEIKIQVAMEALKEMLDKKENMT